MKRLLPTEVRMASLGPTGPRFWTGSSPRTGRLYPPRMTRPPTAAQIDNLLRANMMDLLILWAQRSLSFRRVSAISPNDGVVIATTCGLFLAPVCLKIDRAQAVVPTTHSHSL